MNANIKVFKVQTGAHYILSGECIMCKIPQAVTVTTQAFFNWQHGTFVQNAFPEATSDQREFLVSGICGKCFDKMFAESDE